MYTIGKKEIDAVANVINSRKMFRYANADSECARFERDFGKYLGVESVALAPSGMEALRAGLIGIGVGPGDEVLVPACTFMASPLAVLAVGAIPVVVDIDESITLSPKAFEKAIGPRTKAVMPVHMWGLPCDMKAIMRIARKRDILVIEDACQATGGSFGGKKLGAFGHVSAFSFNYFKILSCGEGGAFVTNDASVLHRGLCVNECCRFYWEGRSDEADVFASCGSRFSELHAAVLNVQLKRLEPMVRSMRRQKLRILKETADTGLQPIKANDLEGECGTHVMYLLPTTEAAKRFSKAAGGGIAGHTGRHVYTEWDPVLAHNGAHHPAMDPYKMKENRRCRKKYTKSMCAKSLDIVNRAVMIKTSPEHKRSDTTALISKIRRAAEKVL